MTEAQRTVVWKSYYRDSVTLMRVAREVQELQGIHSAAAIMATPANVDMLTEAGFDAPVQPTSPGDLLLAIRGDDSSAVALAFDAVRAIFDRRAESTLARNQPRTLDAAVAVDPSASLAMISVPGEYAAREARRALDLGLDVFLFSDHVSLEDELAIKQKALSLGLLCLGPDCGTAYLDGVGLGFANVVSRGPIGCVAASGTGLQAIATYLDGIHGTGLSHGIGVGGRDLLASVGGLMTLAGIERLGTDAATQVIVLVAKTVDPDVAGRLDEALARTGKPFVSCVLDRKPVRLKHAAFTTNRLDHAAAAAAAVSRGLHPARDLVERERERNDPETAPAAGPKVLGLFGGGTLAAEAAVILRASLPGGVETNLDMEDRDGRHQIVDLGDDEFTLGRPHPMIDSGVRDQAIRDAGRDPEVGVILLDVVLGRGAHPDPATPLAAAVNDARATAERAGRNLVFVASVVGTEDDPQQASKQTATLRDAGIAVSATSALAADRAVRVALMVKADA